MLPHLTPHKLFVDHRGTLLKNFTSVEACGLFKDQNVAEIFHATSSRGVLRGLHLQRSPHGIDKIVTVLNGLIHDVVVDVRPGSTTKGKAWAFELNPASGSSLYIPAGFAHGYQALCDNTIVQYVQSGPYRADFEAGILWSSFEHAWPIANPILSEKDSHLPTLAAYLRAQT